METICKPLDDPTLTIWQKPPANRLNAVVEPCSSRLFTGKTLWAIRGVTSIVGASLIRLNFTASSNVGNTIIILQGARSTR